MYKDKPLIIAKRPFWRHPVFPWGWYSIKQDNIFASEVDGNNSPRDGKYRFDHTSTEPANDGVLMPRIGTVGRWIKQ